MSTNVTDWLQALELPQRSVRFQVRVRTRGQMPLVTVPATDTATLVPLQLSMPVGGSNTMGAPHATSLFVTWGGQMRTTETSSKK